MNYVRRFLSLDAKLFSIPQLACVICDLLLVLDLLFRNCGC